MMSMAWRRWVDPSAAAWACHWTAESDAAWTRIAGGPSVGPLITACVGPNGVSTNSEWNGIGQSPRLASYAVSYGSRRAEPLVQCEQRHRCSARTWSVILERGRRITSYVGPKGGFGMAGRPCRGGPRTAARPRRGRPRGSAGPVAGRGSYDAGRGRPASRSASRADRRADPRLPGGAADRGRRGGRVPAPRRSSSSTTARPTTPRPRPRRPARPSCARSRTPARAPPCGPGSATPSTQGAEAVVTLDADGQHDPAEIPAFLAAFAAGTAGARRRPARLRRDAAGPPAVEHARRLGLSRRRVGRHVPDNQSGYRLIGRRLMRALLDSDRGRLRVRGRDDRPLHRPRPADRLGPDPDDLRRRAEPHPAVAPLHRVRAGQPRRPADRPRRR